MRRLLAALLALTGTAWAQAPPVFRSGVDAVYVDVFVTRNGQPVPGLRAEHFELRDNGVRQSVELAEAETMPLHAMLVFDTSSSLAEGGRLPALRAAGEAFLLGLRPIDEVSLVTFSHEIARRTARSADKGTLRQALAAVEAEGGTALFDALYAGLVLSEGGGRALVVLFSDGEDNMSVLRESQLRQVAERSNALVHIVAWRDAAVRVPAGFRRPIDQGSAWEPDHIRVLRRIAEASGGRLWGADSPERLRQTFAAIADAMGHRYVLRYEPDRSKREGWHQLEVKLRGQKGEVQARKGYWVAP
jgi:VWFA-related protein